MGSLFGCRRVLSFGQSVYLIVENDDIEAHVSSDGMDKMIFTGKVKNVENIIGLSDIGILLTNYGQHQEGISNTILEYMALSKPVIVG